MTKPLCAPPQRLKKIIEKFRDIGKLNKKKLLVFDKFQLFISW